MDGQLVKEYHCWCSVCSEPLLGLAPTADGAERQLRMHSWVKRGGLWVCPKCKGK